MRRLIAANAIRALRFVRLEPMKLLTQIPYWRNSGATGLFTVTSMWLQHVLVVHRALTPAFDLRSSAVGAMPTPWKSTRKEPLDFA